MLLQGLLIRMFVATEKECVDLLSVLEKNSSSKQVEDDSPSLIVDESRMTVEEQERREEPEQTTSNERSDCPVVKQVNQNSSEDYNADSNRSLSDSKTNAFFPALM